MERRVCRWSEQSAAQPWHALRGIFRTVGCCTCGLTCGKDSPVRPRRTSGTAILAVQVTVVAQSAARWLARAANTRPTAWAAVTCTHQARKRGDHRRTVGPLNSSVMRPARPLPSGARSRNGAVDGRRQLRSTSRQLHRTRTPERRQRKLMAQLALATHLAPTGAERPGRREYRLGVSACWCTTDHMERVEQRYRLARRRPSSHDADAATRRRVRLRCPVPM